MARRSQAWKNLERQAADVFGGKRILRGEDFSVSLPDVLVDGMPELKVDAKLRVRHSHHSLLEEIEQKYCQDGDKAVLVTKSHRQSGFCVTVRGDFFAELLDSHRAMKKFTAKCVRELTGEQSPPVDSGDGMDKDD